MVMDPGPCMSDIPKFYYNSKTGTCEMFSYGGCQGNSNRFETISSCTETCITHNRSVHPSLNVDILPQYFSVSSNAS